MESEVELWDVRKGASLVGVCPKTYKAWIKQGVLDIPEVRVGTLVRYPSTHVRAAVAKLVATASEKVPAPRRQAAAARARDGLAAKRAAAILEAESALSMKAAGNAGLAR